MKKRSASRRSFLKAVGAGATALPFYRLLENSVAQAAGEPVPLQFMRHLSSARHLGRVLRDAGRPVLGADEGHRDRLQHHLHEQRHAVRAAAVRRRRTYGQSFKSKILPIEGIDLMSNANGHDTAGTILTGSYIDGSKPANSSLDQYMAVERKLGAATRVTSIAVGVGDDSTQPGTTLSFGAGRRAAAQDHRPGRRRSTRCSRVTFRPTIRRRPRRRCERAPRAAA